MYENDELAMTYVIWGFLGIKLYKSIDFEIYVTISLADGMDYDLYFNFSILHVTIFVFDVCPFSG